MQRALALPARQRGLTMTGFLFTAFVLVMIAMLAMKLVPAYIEFFAVKRILATMGQEANLKNMGNADIRKDFTRRAGADFISAVGADDLSIEQTADAKLVTARYEFRTKLMGNVSLVVDFEASSDPEAAAAAVE
jgi:hypothetical protein